MDQKSQTRRQVVRSVLSLAGVFLVLHLAQRNDVLSDLTRPFVLGILRLFGIDVLQTNEALWVGRLVIPWSRDCAGLNVLGILWAMTLWTNRSEPRVDRYLGRLLLAVPAAMLANVARILTLIGYRHLLYPAVESPQLHYFIGFLWLVPLMWFFCPRGGRSVRRYTLETLHLAAALSLLAPLVLAPGGSLVALGTVLLLANSQFDRERMGQPAAPLVAWGAFAMLIAMTRMESLWLPWLIACPAFTSLRAAFSWTGFALWLGTLPLLAMHPVGQWGLPVVATLHIWQWSRSQSLTQKSSLSIATKPPRLSSAWAGAVTLALLIPFAASPLNGLLARPGVPPVAARARDLGANAFRLNLVGQPPDLDMVWYEPTGEGRHHALEVCLQYRGVTLRPAAVAQVKTDGQVWMREFFLQRGTLVQSYRDYLRRTFLPLSPAGIHLIASSRVESMTAESFAESSAQMARDVCQLLNP